MTVTVTGTADSGTIILEVPAEWADRRDRDRVVLDAIAERRFAPADLVAYQLLGVLPAALTGLTFEWPATPRPTAGGGPGGS